MLKKSSRKILEKITVDRKIIEYLIDGKSLTAIQKILNKGKGYLISIRNRALEFNYIEEIIPGEKRYKSGIKKLPPYPESPFGIIDNKNEKALETDTYLESEKSWITECIEADWSPQSIFEELKKPIARTTFYRYMHRNNFMKKSPLASSSMELVHFPGECLQVDWAKLFDVIDPSTNKRKTISIFIGILGHSRYQMVRVVEKLDFQTTIAALESMFQEMGGVPRKVTSDNPKVFVNVASKYEPSLNPGFERFASHYGFTIEALPPADPQKKGKVERSVQYVRRLFESYDSKNYNLESAQEHIYKKNELANSRKHGTHLQKPIDVFINQEAGSLKSLPSLSFETETISYSRVRVDGYVRFENKYYRVHDKFRGEECLVIGNKIQISIYCKGLLLDIYDRITDSFISKACKDCYKQDFEKTLNDHRYLVTRGKKLGESVAHFIEIILGRGDGFVDLRVIWGLLSLDKKYSGHAINEACKAAIELSSVKLRTVTAFLKLSTEKETTFKSELEENFNIKNGKFARPMSVYKRHLQLIQ